MSAGLRDFVKQISPPWLSTGVAEKLLYVVGLGADACLEKLNQGMRLHMPTYGDASGLPYVGADRLIPQGLNEPSNSYAQRLKLWLDAWQVAGSVRSVLQQVLGAVQPALPLVRAVSDTSAWDTYTAGPYLPATTPGATYPSHQLVTPGNWNWDNEADPHPGPLGNSATAWWRWWLLLFSDLSPVGGGVTAATNASPIAITTTAPHGLTTGAIVWVTAVAGNLAANSPNGSSAPWTIIVTGASSFTLTGSTGSGAYTSGGTVYLVTDPTIKPTSQNWILPAPVVGASGFSMGDKRYAWGFSLPNGQSGTAGFIAGVLAIVSLWKSAESWCRYTITSFDNARFDPARTADGTHNPDGTWGPPFVVATVANVVQYTISNRSPDARYSGPVQ